MKKNAAAGDTPKEIVIESVEVEIAGYNGQENDAEQPCENLQPSSAPDAYKRMHESDVDWNAEHEEEVNGSVNKKGEIFFRQDGNQSHVGIQDGAQETDAGKKNIGPFPSSPQKGDQRNAQHDDKSKKRWNDISRHRLQVIRNHVASLLQKLFCWANPLSDHS